MRWLAIGSILGALVAFAAPARAQATGTTTAPATTHWAVAAATPHYGPSAAILLGLATNDLNVGFGARGGYTLPNNIYVGGTVLYHFGASNEATFMGVSTKTTSHLFYLGPEGGYDLAVGPVLIRPYLGLGFESFSASVSCTPSNLCAGSTTDTNFALWVGGLVLYPIGNFFVGGDLRALFVSNANSIGVFATGGMNF